MRWVDHNVTWTSGAVVTCERKGYKPRQFQVTNVDTNQRTSTYTLTPTDGTAYWEREASEGPDQ